MEVDDRNDLEVEKARLLCLALDFGFNEDSAGRCLDRLISLYGDDGHEFITVDHCGDDFLAELAEAMQDTEEWDDLQATESEACGALMDMFGNNRDGGVEKGDLKTVNYGDCGADYSMHPQKNQVILKLDSCSGSEESEDEDVWTGNPGKRSRPSLLEIRSKGSALSSPILDKCSSESANCKKNATRRSKSLTSSKQHRSQTSSF